eukprot:TRINITY_DN968_c0_g1_i2.p1 TRINITY_DN968_c0_g1~~TRINITY_DN968_c0_g1_i2.p1  ORF type:complete len:1104 (-),score=139.67 TRINITY_DN968_c0_g1_i2:1098-4409(-)
MDFDHFELLGKVSDNVIHARDRTTGIHVLVTRYQFDDTSTSVAPRLQALRISHEYGAIRMIDAFLGPPAREGDSQRLLYVEEPADCSSLHDLLYGLTRPTRGSIQPAHLQEVAAKLLGCLRIVHRTGQGHNGLTPSCVVLDARSELFLRPFNPTSAEQQPATVYERWYMPPEFLLGVPTASVTDSADAGDMWAVGCIIAELATGVQLFAADDSAAQLMHIFQCLGFPTRADMAYLGSRFDKLAFPTAISGGGSLQSLAGITPQLLELLRALLCFDPIARVSAAGALRMSYFHSQSETQSTTLDMSLQQVLGIDDGPFQDPDRIDAKYLEAEPIEQLLEGASTALSSVYDNSDVRQQRYSSTRLNTSKSGTTIASAFDLDTLPLTLPSKSPAAKRIGSVSYTRPVHYVSPMTASIQRRSHAPAPASVTSRQVASQEDLEIVALLNGGLSPNAPQRLLQQSPKRARSSLPNPVEVARSSASGIHASDPRHHVPELYKSRGRTQRQRRVTKSPSRHAPSSSALPSARPRSASRSSCRRTGVSRSRSPAHRYTPSGTSRPRSTRSRTRSPSKSVRFNGKGKMQAENAHLYMQPLAALAPLSFDALRKKSKPSPVAPPPTPPLEQQSSSEEQPAQTKPQARIPQDDIIAQLQRERKQTSRELEMLRAQVRTLQAERAVKSPTRTRSPNRQATSSAYTAPLSLSSSENVPELSRSLSAGRTGRKSPPQPVRSTTEWEHDQLKAKLDQQLQHLRDKVGHVDATNKLLSESSSIDTASSWQDAAVFAQRAFNDVSNTNSSRRLQPAIPPGMVEFEISIVRVLNIVATRRVTTVHCSYEHPVPSARTIASSAPLETISTHRAPFSDNIVFGHTASFRCDEIILRVRCKSPLRVDVFGDDVLLGQASIDLRPLLLTETDLQASYLIRDVHSRELGHMHVLVRPTPQLFTHHAAAEMKENPIEHPLSPRTPVRAAASEFHPGTPHSVMSTRSEESRNEVEALKRLRQNLLLFNRSSDLVSRAVGRTPGSLESHLDTEAATDALESLFSSRPMRSAPPPPQLSTTPAHTESRSSDSRQANATPVEHQQLLEQATQLEERQERILQTMEDLRASLL